MIVIPKFVFNAGDDYVILPPLNFVIPASESSVQLCVSFRVVDDNLALEGVEQFEFFFENLPSYSVTVGDQSTLRVNITDNDGRYTSN